MAPYTMTITVQNATDSALTWIGTSTYSPLDGTTQILEATERIEPNQSGRVKISKSGGTDGLFTIASYKFPQRSSSVHIYAMMPAAAGFKATVKFVDHSAMNQPQLTNNGENGAATMWYRRQGDAAMTDGPWSDNVVEMKWGIMGPEWKYQPGAGDQEVWRITRTLSKDSMSFPDSSCTVRVTSKSLGRMNWNLDQYGISYNS